MSRSWKAGIAVIALLAGTAYAVAQMAPSEHGMHDRMGDKMGASDGTGPVQDHKQMMQKMMQQGMHGSMGSGHSMTGRAPAMAGEEAFGTIQEIVQILEADPKTDWSKVNIAALREHLIDMHEVTLRAVTTERKLENGLDIFVTGQDRTLEAIKRMVPAHARELTGAGWTANWEELPNGVKLMVTSAEPQQALKIKALGFMGLMVQGEHHRTHHLAMAKGEIQMH